MKLVRYNTPVAKGELNVPHFGGLFDDFDGLFNGFFPAANGWSESLQTREDKDGYYVRLEVPGMKRDDLKVTATGDELVIRGSKKVWGPEKEDTRSFERHLRIPEDIVADKIEARYEDGVLTLNLPKREEVKPREITIQVK